MCKAHERYHSHCLHRRGTRKYRKCKRVWPWKGEDYGKRALGRRLAVMDTEVPARRRTSLHYFQKMLAERNSIRRLAKML